MRSVYRVVQMQLKCPLEHIDTEKCSSSNSRTTLWVICVRECAEGKSCNTGGGRGWVWKHQKQISLTLSLVAMCKSVQELPFSSDLQ